MAKNLAAGIVSGLLVAAFTAVFFGSNETIRNIIIMYPAELITSYILVAVLVAIFVWVIAEILWKRATNKLKSEHNRIFEENLELKERLHDLEEAHLECKIVSTGKGARKMIDSWDSKSK